MFSIVLFFAMISCRALFSFSRVAKMINGTVNAGVVQNNQKMLAVLAEAEAKFNDLSEFQMIKPNFLFQRNCS
jgi:hypothetical protein